jgi:hypothetical protein
MSSGNGSEFNIGDEWVYRLRDYEPSERVRIDALEPKKTTVRVQVTFLDQGERTENVPGSRLRVPWAEVDAYDQLQANWERLEDISLDPVEQSVVSQVFEVVIPQDVADYDAPQVLDAMTIYDKDGLAELLGPDVLSEIMLQTPWFDIDGKIMVSPKGTLSIAEAACRAQPVPLLDALVEQEKEIREKCKRGGTRPNLSDRGTSSTSPEWEYYWYLRYERPRHELLRQWCGHRAVTFQERLTAAEAETRRLDILLAQAIDALKKDQTTLAGILEEEHERERIAPERARPIIDRPLSPSEIPVREVRVRRRWGY